MLILAPACAIAQEAGRALPDDPPAAQAQPYVGPAPYCRDGEGNRRELGEVICVTASCTTWMARCEQVLNNSTWRKLGDGCPAAQLEAGPRARFERLRPAFEPRGIDAHIPFSKA